MATTKSTKSTKSAKSTPKTTSVVCPKCGAEIAIPEHSSVTLGVTIGKDSGLGTITLPLANEGNGAPKNVKATAKTALEMLMEIAKTDPEGFKSINELVDKVAASGYIDTSRIVARWMPAQTLRMLNSKDGFHNALKLKGYDYAWDVLLMKLKQQIRINKDGDYNELEKAQRWYNYKLGVVMAADYVKQLSDYLDRAPRHRHRCRMYVKLRVKGLNNGKGVYVSEFQNLIDWLKGGLDRITRFTKVNAVYEFFKKFNERRRCIHWTPSEVPMDFINCYKAAGAYATIKDLIMFEDCRMKVDKKDKVSQSGSHWCWEGGRKFIEKEQSLEALEDYANAIANSTYRGTMDNGYKFIGLLKDFIQYNNFDTKKVVKSWEESSKARKAFRANNRSSRRSRK